MDARDSRLSARALAALALALWLAACGKANAPVDEDAAPQEAAAREDSLLPTNEARDAASAPAPRYDEGATPMAERVAVMGVLNKRNNITQTVEMKPGEMRRIGNIELRVEACERTAPWEIPQEIGAFAQVSVRERRQSDFRRIFSGWLFRNSPSLNVVEHPVYDVWVKDCKMRFPGEDSRGGNGSSEAPAAKAR